jgi:hypothetical protein
VRVASFKPRCAITRCAGVLFLGYFSGPVEGILMICCIYFISGTFGL